MAKGKTNEPELPAVDYVTETITYVPGPLDPSVVKWAGQTFHANVPKEITGHAEGTKTEQLNYGIIESAKGNKHFTVGNARPKRDVIAEPTTAAEYRAYAVNWIKDPNIEHVDQLIGRFARDRELQAVCEVGTDDFAWLATLFMPRLYELQKMDELTDIQVGTLWVNHGINQLPW